MLYTKKPTILCDIDGILVDFTTSYLEVLQQVTGREHQEHEIHSFNYHESIASKEEDAECWKRIAATPGFVLGLPLYPLALDFLGALRGLGRVVACTSPASALWTAERATWLLESAGFAKRDIVVCSDKGLIEGDYLIDDAFHNVSEWDTARRQLDPDGEMGDRLPILFSRAWNLKFDTYGVCARAWNYTEVFNLIAKNEAR